MICPSCHKFPSFDIAEPEVEIEVENGIVTGTVRLFLTTACCAEEAKETTFDVEIDMTDEIIESLKKAGVTEPDLELEGVLMEITSESASGDDRYEGKGKRPKHFYTVSFEGEVKVTYPVKDAEPIIMTVPFPDWKDEVGAGEMEELS